MKSYTPIALNSALRPGGDLRDRPTFRGESISFIIRIFTIMVGIAAVVFVAGIVTKRHRELSSLRAELQSLDKAKGEQEKILANLNVELSHLKEGKSINAKARRLGLRPATRRQMRYSTQVARHYPQDDREAPTRVSSTARYTP